MSDVEDESDRTLAQKVIAELPSDATTSDILLAINQRDELQFRLEQSQRHQQAVAKPPRTVWSRLLDKLGCLVAAVAIPMFFLSMPAIFSLGERVLPRPTRPIEQGVIKRIVFSDGKEDSNLVGRKCRVLSSHVLIEAENGSTVLIPSENYRAIELEPSRE